jgi:DNA-binding HxlR family transcriptional regulator
MTKKNCDFVLLELLGKKHILNIIKFLGEENRCLRFNEIQRSLAINTKSLSDRLNDLEQTGLVIRKSFDTIPPKVEYRLAEINVEIKQIMDAIHNLEVKILSH